MTYQHVTLAVTQEAFGARAAQDVIDGLREGSVSPDRAWLEFVQLAARYGRSSPACASYVREFAKRVAD